MQYNDYSNRCPYSKINNYNSNEELEEEYFSEEEVDEYEQPSENSISYFVRSGLNYLDQYPLTKYIITWIKNPLSWGKNTASYIFHGPFRALQKEMSGENIKKLSMAHKILLYGIIENKGVEDKEHNIAMKILKEGRDSECWYGGEEFAVVEALTGKNPLTEDIPEKHHELKKFVNRNTFGSHNIRNNNYWFSDICNQFIKNNLAIIDDQPSINISTEITKYILEISSKIILGLRESPDNIEEIVSKHENVASHDICFKKSKVLPNEKNEATEQLNEVVDAIMEELDSTNGIAKHMKDAPLFKDKELEKVKGIIDALNNKPISKELLEKIHSIITNRTFSYHFFERIDAEEAPLLTALKEVKNKDLPYLNEEFIEAFLEEGEAKLTSDILQELVKTNRKFSDQQIRDIIKVTFLVGTGTTKSNIIAILYLLIMNENEQDKLYEAITDLDIPEVSKEEWDHLSQLTIEEITEEELQQLQGIDCNLFDKYKKDVIQIERLQSLTLEQVTEEDLKSLISYYQSSINLLIKEKVLNCPELMNVVNEALRMYTPVGILARTAKKDNVYPLSEKENNTLTIPKGYTVFVANIFANNNPECWKNPEVFTPDRYKENPNLTKKIRAFNEETPNQCMGIYQAKTAIGVFAYHFFKRYKVIKPIDEDGYTIEQKLNPRLGLALLYDDLYIGLEER